MTVIALIGSTRFQDEFRRVERILTLKNNVVLGLSVFGQSDFPSYDWDADGFDFIPTLTSVAHQKINMAELVIVIDVNGYVGAATKAEIQYTISLNKATYRLSDILKSNFGPYGELRPNKVNCPIGSCKEYFSKGMQGTGMWADIEAQIDAHMRAVHKGWYKDSSGIGWHPPTVDSDLGYAD